MSGDSYGSDRLPSLTAPSTSSYASSLHSHSHQLARNRNNVSNTKYDQMARFMSELAEDQFKDTGSGKSIGVTKIQIIPSLNSTRSRRHSRPTQEEKEESRRMNEIRDQRDLSKRKFDRVGPGSSLGGVGDRFSLLSSTYYHQQLSDDPHERGSATVQEDEEISKPHLVLEMERSADGKSRTVARDDRIGGRRGGEEKAPMTIPSFLRKQYARSTRSLSPPPDWLAPHLSLHSAPPSATTRPTKRRKTSIAHSVTSHPVPVGHYSSSSPTRADEEDGGYYPIRADEEGGGYGREDFERPFATNGYATTPSNYRPPMTESIYERQLERIDYYSPSRLQPDPHASSSHDYPLQQEQHADYQAQQPHFPTRQFAPIYHSSPSIGAEQCTPGYGERKQLYLQERLENVVDDLTNFWKKTKEVSSSSHEIPNEQHQFVEAEDSRFDDYQQTNDSPRTIYGQQILPDYSPPPHASFGGQESQFDSPPLQFDAQPLLENGVHFISQIPPPSTRPLISTNTLPRPLPLRLPSLPLDDSHNAPSRQSTPNFDAPQLRGSYVLETPVHSHPPLDSFAKFRGEVRSDELDEEEGGDDVERGERGEVEERLVESEYEFSYSQVPSINLDEFLSYETTKNHALGIASSPPTTLTSFSLERSEEDDLSSKSSKDGDGGGGGNGGLEGGEEVDVEPGWRRRRAGRAAVSVIQEEEEELLLLSEDLSIEELEILNACDG